MVFVNYSSHFFIGTGNYPFPIPFLFGTGNYPFPWYVIIQRKWKKHMQKKLQICIAPT
jgi:hypothetical protein